MADTRTDSCTDRTLVVSGGSRGIGLAIAVGAADRAPTWCCWPRPPRPTRSCPARCYTAAAEIEAAGGKAAAVVGDVRQEEDVQRAVDTAVQRFGGVDICVNNASAIATDPTDAAVAPRSST